jgi:hypothetical protein
MNLIKKLTEKAREEWHALYSDRRWLAGALAAAAILIPSAIALNNYQASQIQIERQQQEERRTKQVKETYENKKFEEQQKAFVRQNWSDYYANLFRKEMETELAKLDNSNLNLEARTEQANLKFSGRLERLNVYASIIEQEVQKYNAKFNFPEELTAEHIYRMIMVEAPTGRAFMKDPMQIANRGDHALRALANSEENTQQIDDFSYLKNIKPTKIKNWKRIYDSNLTPEDSIKAGMGWLIQKAAIRDKNGKIIGWRSWDKATERYNGKGDKSYMDKIIGWNEKINASSYSES